MDIRSMILGPVQTNVYFLINTDSNEAILFDPAYSPEKILDFLKKKELTLKAIFLTHGHFDHITGVRGIKDAFDVPIYASKREERLLSDGQLNESLDSYGYCVTLEADVWLSDSQEVEEAGIRVKMLDTPGHTEGSCCYLVEDEKVLISGDTLFAGSVGRTDLPTGSMKELLSSIEEKLMALPDDVEVYPGHGEPTTIGYERKWNPFFG